MNVRLMIASEQLAALMPMAAQHGVRINGEAVTGCQNDVLAQAALGLADALLAAAGEQETREPRLGEIDKAYLVQHNDVLSVALQAAIARAEAAEAKVAEMKAKFRELRSDYNEAIEANKEWESKCAALEAENAEWVQKAANWMASPEAQKQLEGYRELSMNALRATERAEKAEAENAKLRRQLEPLTRDDVIENGNGPKYWETMTTSEVITLVNYADRIRARRSE